jgi:S1-C subfamily serine protease
MLIRTSEGLGSWVVLGRSGKIVTNAHVAGSATKFQAQAGGVVLAIGNPLGLSGRVTQGSSPPPTARSPSRPLRDRPRLRCPARSRSGLFS